MKVCFSLLACCLVAAPVFAAPPPIKHVPSDAKWVVHVDVDALLRSQVGEFIGREFLDPKFNKVAADLRKQFDLELDWRKIHSLTAYGSDSDFEHLQDKKNGVLLVESELDIADALDRVLEKVGAGGGAPFKKLQVEPFAVYGNNDVVGTPVGEHLFILARSRELLESARRGLATKAGGGKVATTAPAKAEASAGFLTVLLSDTQAMGAALPPQARVLKDTQGVRVVAGEKAEHVFVNASLEAKDSDVAQQLQQMLQGVIAFAQMTQTENQDLQQLSQSAKIGGTDNMVTVDLQMPVKDAIAKLGKTQQKKHRG
jgi:hypothetical protein